MRVHNEKLPFVPARRRKLPTFTNYVLEVLNKTIVELNVAKSRNNRIFLEDRYK